MGGEDEVERRRMRRRKRRKVHRNVNLCSPAAVMAITFTVKNLGSSAGPDSYPNLRLMAPHTSIWAELLLLLPPLSFVSLHFAAVPLPRPFHFPAAHIGLQ